MILSEFLPILQKLTDGKTKINQAYLSKALGITTATISDRIKRKSEVTVSELEQIENYANIKIFVRTDDETFSIVENTLERQNDTSVHEKSLQFGQRLVELQAKHNFLDREMATLLKISEKDYLKLVLGKIKPDLEILNCLKQNFKVSIDYLLYGK